MKKADRLFSSKDVYIYMRARVVEKGQVLLLLLLLLALILYESLWDRSVAGRRMGERRITACAHQEQESVGDHMGVYAYIYVGITYMCILG